MKLFKHLCAVLAALVASVQPALAQTYPDRVIKMVVPFPAGSTVDVLARFMADEMRKGLGQTVIIDNQVGADGIVAAAKEVNLSVPLVVRLEGTNVDLGKDILNNSGLPIVAANDLGDAAQKIVAEVAKAKA